MCSAIQMNASVEHEPCNCGLPVATIQEDGKGYQALMSYAMWAINMQQDQMQMASELSKKAQGEVLKNLQGSLKAARSTKAKLESVRKKIAGSSKLTKKQYSSFVIEINQTNGNGLKAVANFWKKKKPKPGLGDCGEEYQKPDCSSSAQTVNRSCADGVNIMATCGFYSENGGAEAMQNDLESCGLASQNMMQMCLAAVSMCQPFGTRMIRQDYESNAYMVCSQVDDDRLNQAPEQTETSTGN